MKRNILTAIAVIASAGALAQGTLNLSTTPAAIGSTQKVFEADGVTPLSGANGYSAILFVGPTEGSLAAVGSAPGTQLFKNGSGAGYWSDAGSPGVAANIGLSANGFGQLVVLKDGAEAGRSAIFALRTGGGGSPPDVPGNLTNFKSFSLIPEPSTIALGLLGAASLLFFRRK